MIRKQRISAKALETWLSEKKSCSADGRYTLRLLVEEATGRGHVWDELVAYFQEAHEDARVKLRKALRPSLSPFVSGGDQVTSGYPEGLHIKTLMGYFGEVLAGLIAEHKDVHGHSSWTVPVFLFRFHQIAFQYLERIRNLEKQGLPTPPIDGPSTTLVGRTGDDALAFLVAPDGSLAAVLVCEAKCLEGHRSDVLVEAHEKLSQETERPDSLGELIELIAEYESPEAQAWYERLAAYHFDASKKIDRYDLVLYAIGDKPKGRQGRTSWLPRNAPHDKYKGNRRLEAVEVQIANTPDLVTRLYRHKA